MQQATVNLFADMGVQPATLQAGLVAATALDRHDARPTSTITAPAAGATRAVGTPVTITGTATDTGGGVVGGVEVSTDGGSTWHRPTGTQLAGPTRWTPDGRGTATLRAGPTDDSAQPRRAASGVTVTVGGRTCPCTHLVRPPPTAGATRTRPTRAPSSSASSSAPTSAGSITGIRFYKSSQNTGTHVGHLWSRAGHAARHGHVHRRDRQRLAAGDFATPVRVSANTTYVASYYAPNGHYADDDGSFTTAGIDSAAAARAAERRRRSQRRLRRRSAPFPTNTFAASNYWVDVVFS